MVIAGYIASTLSGATPITLTTTLTHIYLGDEKIATFQSQTDDTPKTPDDDKIIFHISDHLNSSSLDLSSTGVLLQAVDYLPFGKSNTYEITSKRVKGKKGGYTNKYQFANKQLDKESDLQYFEKRYYDNRIGRFTTEDPVFWEVGLTKRPNQYFTDPQSWNTYSYTRNNPINLVDPTGEFWDTLWDTANVIYDAGKIVKNAVEVTYEGARNIYGTVTNNQSIINDSQKGWEQDAKELDEGLFDAGTDALAAAIPFVPAGASKVARAAGESVIKNASKVPKPDIFKIVNEKLKSIVERNYRATATVGNGSTADAIRYTKQTGELVKGSDHLQKGQDTVNGLQNLLRNGNLNVSDRQAARSILNDIKNALSGN